MGEIIPAWPRLIKSAKSAFKTLIVPTWSWHAYSIADTSQSDMVLYSVRPRTMGIQCILFNNIAELYNDYTLRAPE